MVRASRDMDISQQTTLKLPIPYSTAKTGLQKLCIASLVHVTDKTDYALVDENRWYMPDFRLLYTWFNFFFPTHRNYGTVSEKIFVDALNNS
jgi:hypothetical protein